MRNNERGEGERKKEAKRKKARERHRLTTHQSKLIENILKAYKKTEHVG